MSDDWEYEADHDAHVRTRERFDDLVLVLLCERISEDLKKECERAYERVEIAKRNARAALERLNRATTMLEQACKLHAIHSGR